jgi:hypothetical protein
LDIGDKSEGLISGITITSQIPCTRIGKQPRKTFTGSKREARYAGTRLAISETRASVAATQANVIVFDISDSVARFFTDNPHLAAPYRDRLVAIALCEGAALQYLGRGCGVNDFDVHFFYTQNTQKPRLTRARKRIFADVRYLTNIDAPFGFDVKYKNGQRESFTWLCLPDTIDPRPKAK